MGSRNPFVGVEKLAKDWDKNRFNDTHTLFDKDFQLKENLNKFRAELLENVDKLAATPPPLADIEKRREAANTLCDVMERDLAIQFKKLQNKKEETPDLEEVWKKIVGDAIPKLDDVFGGPTPPAAPPLAGPGFTAEEQAQADLEHKAQTQLMSESLASQKAKLEVIKEEKLKRGNGKINGKHGET